MICLDFVGLLLDMHRADRVPTTDGEQENNIELNTTHFLFGGWSRENQTSFLEYAYDRAQHMSNPFLDLTNESKRPQSHQSGQVLALCKV